MPAEVTGAPPSWAANVRLVVLLGAPIAELERISAERGLGFDRLELRRIQAYFRAEAREPTDVELAGIAQSWSEHCSYKSSRVFLRRSFSKLHPKPRVLGTGDAGVMAFEPGWAYALRIESHNHPSAVEPYGGAATGIGGILRDVLAVGAKPIALADPIFFGPLDLDPEELPMGVKSPRYLMEGVVSGIRDYGNRVGVPTVSGGVYFDPSFVVNPLVNVGCVGWLPRSRLLPNRARRAGDRLVLTGGHTGRDGIGGVAFASRELTARSETESRSAVQLGNPILKEPLIHACIEAFDRGLVQGLKDLGGGGIASAVGELVHAGGLGMRIDLARVPLREPGLSPWEVWISESQERMALDIAPEDIEEAAAIFRRHDVPFTDIGEVTPGPYEELEWEGRPIARLRVGFRVDPEPRHRPYRVRHRRFPRTPSVPDSNLEGLVEELVLAPDSRSREAFLRVYDHEVQGHTVIKPLHGRVATPSHGDAAVLQPRPESWKGLAITVAAQPWTCSADPYVGGVAVVEEAARNLYAVGARPDAFTNCLNFGNPEDPRVLGDLSEVVRGLAAGARALGFAVPSGNVSLYNGGIGHEIPPTPVVMATGIVPDIRRAVTSDLKSAGNSIYLVGRSLPELGGSLWARRHAAVPLAPPRPRPTETRRAGESILGAGRKGWLRAAHDISDGGLAVALCEMAFGGGLGFTADLKAAGLATPGLALAAEGASRWVVEVAAGREAAFERVVRPTRAARIGTVQVGPGRWLWAGAPKATTDLQALYEQWRRGPG